ncbi:hypothetical protein CEXT_758341 [Caerostris extrusa]|uniref:Uncharacterized protein n=1 Tax=Caerostris extrusa TaxID=172846 RepID=A0AAV4Y8U8_CAEEX|nr:hypothetical protein CEXT_758341 [Caerostris extrusa]
MSIKALSKLCGGLFGTIKTVWLSIKAYSALSKLCRKRHSATLSNRGVHQSFGTRDVHQNYQNCVNVHQSLFGIRNCALSNFTRHYQNRVAVHQATMTLSKLGSPSKLIRHYQNCVMSTQSLFGTIKTVWLSIKAYSALLLSKTLSKPCGCPSELHDTIKTAW